jgi:hypothetical protein
MTADCELGIQAARNDFPRMQWLIQEGRANVNATYKFGTTSLLLAAQNPGAGADSAMCLWLVEHGNTPTERTSGTPWAYRILLHPKTKMRRRWCCCGPCCSKLRPLPMWWPVCVRKIYGLCRRGRGCKHGSRPTSHSGGPSWTHTVRCWHHSELSSPDTRSPQQPGSSGPRGSARLRDSSCAFILSSSAPPDISTLGGRRRARG